MMLTWTPSLSSVQLPWKHPIHFLQDTLQGRSIHFPGIDISLPSLITQTRHAGRPKVGWVSSARLPLCWREIIFGGKIISLNALIKPTLQQQSSGHKFIVSYMLTTDRVWTHLFFHPIFGVIFLGIRSEQNVKEPNKSNVETMGKYREKKRKPILQRTKSISLSPFTA